MNKIRNIENENKNNIKKEGVQTKETIGNKIISTQKIKHTSKFNKKNKKKEKKEN